MQDSTACAWLALHECKCLTDRSLARLIVAANDPSGIFSLSHEQLIQLDIDLPAQQALARLAATVDFSHYQQQWHTLQQQGVELLSLSCDNYPALLKHISDPPPLLYIKGNSSLLAQPQLAMVGSRRTTRQGAENAYRFASEFARQGFAVTSGLALGIDAECHRGALSVGGSTIAVLGTGIDVVYPYRNRSLFAEIANSGVVVSEFPLGTKPQRFTFPKRNRIISGMSLGVVVVEAAVKSGSLITAEYALEQDREVFAVPGSIHSFGSEGCHWLIKQGAKLMVSAADVLEELQGWLPPPTAVTNSPPQLSRKPSAPAELPDELDTHQRTLLDCLGFDPATLEILQQRCDWPMAEVMAVMTSLELQGFVENCAGRFQRIGK